MQKKNKIFNFFFTIFCALVANVHATVYYLDSSAVGDESGLTLENAFTTLDQTTASLSDGDTLLISGGNDSKIYYLNSPFISPSDFKLAVIPIEGHNGKVIIDGQDFVAPLIEIKNKANIVIDGEIDRQRHLVFQNWGGAGPGKYSTAISGYGTGKLISNLTIRFVEIRNNDTQCNSTDCSDIELKRCAHLGRTGEGTIIEYNYFEGCIRENLVVGTGGWNSSTVYDDNIVQYNEFRGFRNLEGKGGPDGVKGGGNTIIRFNKIYHEGLKNAEYNISHAYEDGIQILYAYNQIYGNLVHGYSQGAIRTDAIPPSYNTSNLYVYNNLIYSTGTWGAQRGISLDGGDGGFNNIHLYNNTIVGFAYRGINIGTTSETKISDISIMNNILIDNPLVIDTDGDTSLVKVDHNLCLDENYEYIGCYHTQLNEPYSSTKTFSFVSYALGSETNNFRLSESATMAIATGKDLSNYFNDDIQGFSREKWDLGAYAFGSENPDQLSAPVIKAINQK